MRAICRGGKTTAVTERGTTVETQYAIIDVGKLIASHDAGLRINPNYPAILQPRDRERVASEDQIGRIARYLNPTLLTVSPKASDGAPIIGDDYIVESGNARAVALLRAYDKAGERSKSYKRHLVAIAKSLGLDAAKIRVAGRPMLVRVRLTEVDRNQFARECNEQTIAAMSASEQARVDADRLDSAMLSLFETDDAGNIATASNRDFVRAFIDRVIAPADRGRVMDSEGRLSQEGVRRIQNALIARAYPETSAIERLAEATEDNVRRISTVLLRKAAAFARLKIAIADGARFDYDLTPYISGAMQKLSELRDQKMPVQDFLNQRVLCGPDLCSISRRVLDLFDRCQSAKVLEDVLSEFLNGVEAIGHPAQQQLMPRAIITTEEMLSDAIARVNDRLPLPMRFDKNAVVELPIPLPGENVMLTLNRGKTKKVFQVAIQPKGKLFVVNWTFGSQRTMKLVNGTETPKPVSRAAAEEACTRVINKHLRRGYVRVHSLEAKAA